MSFPNPTDPSHSSNVSDSSNVFLIDIENKEQLFRVYMSFISNGALFVKTEKQFKLEDEVFLVVKLIDEAEKYKVRGKVAWITPACAQGGLTTGIGVQFSDDASEIRSKIETYLAGSLTAGRPTDTM